MWVIKVVRLLFVRGLCSSDDDDDVCGEYNNKKTKASVMNNRDGGGGERLPLGGKGKYKKKHITFIEE